MRPSWIWKIDCKGVREVNEGEVVKADVSPQAAGEICATNGTRREMLTQHVRVLLARQSGLCLRVSADINNNHKDHTASDSHTFSKAWMDRWMGDGWMEIADTGPCHWQAEAELTSSNYAHHAKMLCGHHRRIIYRSKVQGNLDHSATYHMSEKEDATALARCR